MAAHFVAQTSPLSREHIAMSLFSIAVLVLLFVRHRGNLARIWAGTERRVSFQRHGQKPGRPSAPCGKACRAGRVRPGPGFAGRGRRIQVYRQATQPIEVSAGPWTLRETDRAATGQQRVDRVAFAAGGSRLAATCPRYDRLVMYGVEAEASCSSRERSSSRGALSVWPHLATDSSCSRRPRGDQRHVEPGWWETFDSDGNRIGGRNWPAIIPTTSPSRPTASICSRAQLGTGRR